MPTYEYRCPDGHEFEKFQKMSDPPRARCPECGKQASRKISGGAGLVFKGSGFYITDYGKDGKGPRKPSGDEGGAAPKADKPESKAEAKPEKKAPPESSGGKSPGKASS